MSTQEATSKVPPRELAAGQRHNFNVTLTHATYEELKAVAKVQGITKVQVIRHLISLAANMHVHNIPYCVNGSRCFTPQSHPPPAAAPHQNILPVDV